MQPRTLTATYSAGDLPVKSEYYGVTTGYRNSSPGVLTFEVPPGYRVAAVDTSYAMTALEVTGSRGMEYQRSFLLCSQGLSEAAAIPPAAEFTGYGTATYSRSGLTLANGVLGPGPLTFQLHLFWQATSWFYWYPVTSTAYHLCPSGSWSVSVHLVPHPADGDGPKWVAFSTTDVSLNQAPYRFRVSIPDQQLPLLQKGDLLIGAAMVNSFITTPPQPPAGWEQIYLESFPSGLTRPYDYVLAASRIWDGEEPPAFALDRSADMDGVTYTDYALLRLLVYRGARIAEVEQASLPMNGDPFALPLQLEPQADQLVVGFSFTNWAWSTLFNYHTLKSNPAGSEPAVFLHHGADYGYARRNSSWHVSRGRVVVGHTLDGRTFKPEIPLQILQLLLVSTRPGLLSAETLQGLRTAFRLPWSPQAADAMAADLEAIDRLWPQAAEALLAALEAIAAIDGRLQALSPADHRALLLREQRGPDPQLPALASPPVQRADVISYATDLLRSERQQRYQEPLSTAEGLERQRLALLTPLLAIVPSLAPLSRDPAIRRLAP